MLLLNSLFLTIIPLAHIFFHIPKLVYFFLFNFIYLYSIKFTDFKFFFNGPSKMDLLFSGFTLFLLSFYKKQYVSTVRNLSSFFYISLKTFSWYLIKAILTILFEEIFYRGFLFTQFPPSNQPLFILFSALIFAFTHQLNRWSKLFSLRVESAQFFLGIVLGLELLESHSIWGCFFNHLLFNSGYIMALIHRLFMKEETFDDL